MRREALRVAISFFAVWALSCSSARFPRVPGDPPPTYGDVRREADYLATVDRNTRSTAIYDNLDSRVFLQATWHSPEFAKARAEREASFQALSSAATEALIDDASVRARDATEFFFAVHVNDSRFDDFDRRSSMWRLVLWVDGKEYALQNIERLGRSTPKLRAYYSYFESFWVAYRLQFPAIDEATVSELKLRVSSVLGQAELVFVNKRSP